MNAKDAILYLYDKELLNIDAIMKNKDSIMQELDNATENKPKHDPTRLFKNGDRAQVVERNGRTPTCFPVGRIKVGDIVTVAENEAGDVFIKVLTEDGHEMMVPWFMLELVTPVEELKPYSVEESCGGANLHCFILKRGKKHLSYYLYKAGNANHYYTREEAKAAAEAERDRLNAEWRKEHQK